MGCRVHVIKKQREYGNSEAFNYKIEEFSDLLSELGCEVCAQDDCSDFFEVSCEHYKNAIKVLKLFKKNTTEETFEKACEKAFNNKDYTNIGLREDIEDCIETLCVESVDEMIDIMETFYRERDKKSAWIQFEMW